MPARLGHVPVPAEPLGWDAERGYEHLYPRVNLSFQVVRRLELGRPDLEPNRLFLGDNLHVMRALPSESIDLIYIDPPFFTQRSHNVLFGARDELRSFRDVWEGGLNGYLVWLNARLYEMKRLLRPSGVIYVHLDWHAGHYVKVEMDRLFGYSNFRNEIVWCYSGGGLPRRDFPRKHDVILRYSKTDAYAFRVQRKPYKENTRQVGIHSTYGRRQGKDVAIDLDRGTPVTDWWPDVPTVTGWSPEKLGYPTQKPEQLLERMVRADTEPGEVVADFFCGGGTTPAVAQRLGRRWIGCDLSRVAVSLTADRVAKAADGEEQATSEKQASRSVPDVEIANWGVYEVKGLTRMTEDSFRGFVLSCYEARAERSGGEIHGYRGVEPVFVGPRDLELPVREERVAGFADAALGRHGGGSTATMIGWAFTEGARRTAERIAARQRLHLRLVKLRLLPLEAPAPSADVTEEERRPRLLSFVLPPAIRLRRERIEARRYRFDASESVALNSGAVIIEVRWDFDYRCCFACTAGLERAEKGEPLLTVEHEFQAPGSHRIAVRALDDLGGEATLFETVDVP